MDERASPAGGPLAEVWGDVVDLRHLAAAIAIGAVISLGTYLIGVRIFASFVTVADVAKAYAMLAGLVACVVSGAICARLFQPKREIVESTQNDAWRQEAIDQLSAETGSVGAIEDLPAAAVAEARELGLYDLFVTASGSSRPASTIAAGSTGRPQAAVGG